MRSSTSSFWRLSGMALALPGVVAAAALAVPTTSVASAAAAKCRTAALVVWLDTQGNGAAGSSYYKLHFTNLSGRACSLVGYPGVSAVNLAGRRLGKPASRNPAHPPAVVTLANGASATSVLQIVDAHNFPRSTCRPVTAAGVRVYPPNQLASKIVPFPFLACSRTGPVYLSVESAAKS